MEGDIFWDVTWTLIEVYRRFIPEDGGSRIPYNFSTLLPEYKSSVPITVLRSSNPSTLNCY